MLTAMQEVTQRVDMRVAAREAESYEYLRATIDRMKIELNQVFGLLNNERNVRNRLEGIIREQRHEIGQYQAALESALQELAIVR